MRYRALSIDCTNAVRTRSASDTVTAGRKIATDIVITIAAINAAVMTSSSVVPRCLEAGLRRNVALHLFRANDAVLVPRHCDEAIEAEQRPLRAVHRLVEVSESRAR